MPAISPREQHFLNVWRMIGQFGKAGEPTLQHKFHPTRKWRFDFAWVDRKVAVEVQGGEFIRGGHNRGRGLMGDCEKMRAAQLLGWIVLPFVGTDLDERPADVVDEITTALMIHGKDES